LKLCLSRKYRTLGDKISLFYGDDWVRWNFGYAGLRPGESSLGFEVVLSKIYDLTKPGEYIVQMERRDENTNVLVKANTITITVIR
jgi:hypothetical protein